MSQSRLNHLMLLHCHKERTSNIDLTQIAKDFIDKTREGKNILEISNYLYSLFILLLVTYIYHYYFFDLF